MTVTIKGKDIHPGLAKGKMINAIRIAARFLEKLPMNARPETTEGDQGFLHPVKMQYAEVSEVKLDMIVRDFKVDGLKHLEDIAKTVAKETEKDFSGSQINIEIREQYRNMVSMLEKDPRVVGYAKEAMEQCGIKPKFFQARGGTDGSKLSYRGLLTPDFPVGTQAVHSKQEWVCLEEMAMTADVVKQLIKIWATS
jgi:tripeptide aminopeptidase